MGKIKENVDKFTREEYKIKVDKALSIEKTKIYRIPINKGYKLVTKEKYEEYLQTKEKLN